MPWTQKQMLRDANGDLIPQYWDVVEQEFKPLTGSDGANDVRLTGSTVEEVIFPRQIRTSNSSIITRSRPKNAVGLFVEHIVYGRTGRFESGEGHSIIAMPYNSSPGRALVGGIKDFRTERSFQFTANDYSFSISLLPYKSFENQTNVSVVVPPIYKSVRFQILISGSFDDGEGIDSELIAQLIFK